MESGMITLARMPAGPHSQAAALVNERIASLTAA